MKVRSCLAVRAALALIALASVLAMPLTAEVAIDSNTFGGLEARAIGPAVMSGRIAALDAVVGPPLTIYVGAASGGLWKSDDGGVRFRPIFDDHTMSIGAVKVDPNDPKTIWVGTGESWARNSTSVGEGVYKSTDGGDSWQHVGLADSERIANIRVHPTDSDTVYVCATGHLWNANEERGVYKTTDGGDTWEQVLGVDENTGCSWLTLDPQDPDILYAGMWQFRRYPDYFESGGPGSGLYKSTDGGVTWTETRDGLPEGDLGRIAVEVAPSRPSTLYAVVEAAENNALYRSNDFGETWEERNASTNISIRPFYFALVVPDPVDHEKVYKPGLSLSVSTDGGKSFNNPLSSAGFTSSVHSDLHALWINPGDPKQLLLGTDGGLYKSHNGGATWRHLNNLPFSQFYQVGYDMEMPYNVYGGLQDNGSWRGPSRSAGGILNKHWDFLLGGDGFHVYTDPEDSDIVYAEYQGGMLSRIDLSGGGGSQEIKPYARGDEEKLRFNWNAALTVSRHDPQTVYFGSQYLHRSRDRGLNWETISPDLTTDDPQRQRQSTTGGLTKDNSTAENNTTIYSIAESPLSADVIWVGSDDGLVHVTRDAGANWDRVSDNIEGLEAGMWVSQVEASPHDDATAFVTFDDHRRGDMASYVYKTTDSGATWSSIAGEGLEGFAHVVRQDPVNSELLFVGTELGLYISLDGGEQWARFSGGVPRVPVHDLQVHPREHDLIVATHGRGIFILDDITPLRALTSEILEQDVALLPSRPAMMMTGGPGAWFPSDAEFIGANPPEAASIYFYQKKRHLFGDFKVEIRDENGELINWAPAPKRRGINRIDWAMRLPPPKLPPATNLVFAFQGPRVPEGVYDFTLVKGKTTLEGKVELVADPRSKHSAEDRKLQQETALRLYHRLTDLTYLVETLAGVRDQARERAEEASGSLERRLEEYADELDAMRGEMVSTDEAGWLSGDEKLRETLGGLFGAINGYEGAPTGSQLERAEVLEAELDAFTERFESTMGEPMEKLNEALGKKDMEPLARTSREEWEAAESSGQGAFVAASKSEARRLLGSLAWRF